MEQKQRTQRHGQPNDIRIIHYTQHSPATGISRTNTIVSTADIELRTRPTILFVEA
jgi:hypothetical protein